MATSTNTIKTRIQLKSDTEENWRKSVLTTDSPLGLKQTGTSFVPLQGELIVYTADATHPFSRLKIGDGITNVVNLPFIDSGSLNGDETIIVKKSNFANFPSPGSDNQLYVDLSTNKIYHYAVGSGYTQLLNFEFNVEKITIEAVTSWYAGRITEATIEDNIFKISNGRLPNLGMEKRSVVTDVTKIINEEE